MQKNKILKIAIFGFFALSLSSCAVLHHIQMMDVDGRISSKGERFEILISETGVNLQEGTNIAKAFANNKKSQNQMQAINDAIAMFQMGPRTGNMVFNESYADSMALLIFEKCPTGEVSSLMSIREMRKYPVVSGEIVKVVGYCLPRRKS